MIAKWLLLLGGAVLFIIFLAFAVAGCGKPKATNAPKPHWEPADFRGYEHWECPRGWHTQDNSPLFPLEKGRVWCESDVTQEQQEERIERSLQPK